MRRECKTKSGGAAAALPRIFATAFCVFQSFLWQSPPPPRVGWRWQRTGLGGLAGSEASPRSSRFSPRLRACHGGDGVRRKLAFLPWGGLGSRLCIKQVVNPCGFQTPWPGNGSNTEIWFILGAVIWGQAWLSLGMPGMLWAQVHPAAGGPLRHQGFWGSLFLLRLNPFVGKRVFQARHAVL